MMYELQDCAGYVLYTGAERPVYDHGTQQWVMPGMLVDDKVGHAFVVMPVADKAAEGTP